MSDEMIKQLVETKNSTTSNMWLISLSISLFDMKVHQPNSHEELENMDFSAEYNRIRRDVTGREGPEAYGEGHAWGHGHAFIGHLMGDYDAGVYGYF